MKLLDHWHHEQLGAICTKIGSGATPRGGETVYQADGTALIRSQNVYNGEFSRDGLAFLDDRHAEQLDGVTIESEDVLLNITGDSVARCCQAPDWVLPARVNQHVAIIRPDRKRLLPKFLCYYLISPLMQTYLLSIAGSGGTRKALTKGMIEGFQVPCPSVDVQQRVIENVGTFNDLIENNRRRMVLLEEAACQLYREWFVRLRFPGHEHIRITNSVPDGWAQAPLGSRVTFNYGKGLIAENRVDGPFNVYGSSGVVGTHVCALVKGPGIVVGRKGNVGSVFWSTHDYYPIDTVYYVDRDTSNLWLYHAIKQLQFISTDVAVPGLNRDFAYSRLVLFPAKRSVSDFMRIVTPFYEQITVLEAVNQKLCDARDLLLPRLMSGEIIV